MAEQAEIMRDVVVVGGGAAGLSAALALARARRRVTVVDAGAPGNAPAKGVHGPQVSAAAADGARATAHINADLVAEGTDRAVARLSNAEAIR